MDLRDWKAAYDKGRGLIDAVIDRNDNGTVGAELAVKLMGYDPDSGDLVQRDGERFTLETLSEQEQALMQLLAINRLIQREGLPKMVQALADEQAALRQALVDAQAQQLNKLDEAQGQEAASREQMLQAWLASLAEREAEDAAVTFVRSSTTGVPTEIAEGG